MKRHSSFKAIQAALLASAALTGLALVPSRQAVADHVEPDPGRAFAVHNGDADADGRIVINDAIYIFLYLYSGGPRPKQLGCEPFTEVHNGDVNASGQLDLSDGIYLLNWLFNGGPAPIEACVDAG